MRAVVAFGRGAFIWIDINGIVWTGLHAGFAPDAALGTEIDDAVLALIHRGYWADSNAGRVLAVITSCYLEHAASIRVNSFFNIFHPGTVHGEGNVILRLAGHGAGVTANALAVVDDKSVSHAERISAAVSRGAKESTRGPSIVADLKA